MSLGKRVIEKKAHENEIFSNFCLQWINQWDFSRPPQYQRVYLISRQVFTDSKKPLSSLLSFLLPTQGPLLLFFSFSTISFLLPCPSNYSFLCIAIGGKICLTTVISYLLASKSHDECGSLHFFFFFF